MIYLDTYAKGELSNKLNKAYDAVSDLVDAIVSFISITLVDSMKDRFKV